MRPIKFPEANVTFGEGQPEYEPLPAWKFPDGEVVTCFELSEEEILRIIDTRCIGFTQLTFNPPLQPVFMTVDKNDVIVENNDESVS